MEIGAFVCYNLRYIVVYFVGNTGLSMRVSLNVYKVSIANQRVLNKKLKIQIDAEFYAESDGHHESR